MELNRSHDENEIRELVSTWMSATKAGDTDTVLDLMADDVIFLVAGKPPFGKIAYAEAANAQAAASMSFDGISEIIEIHVKEDWAYLISKLTVAITQPDKDRALRAGHTMSVFVKRDGRWLLSRDANLLSPANQSENAYET